MENFDRFSINFSGRRRNMVNLGVNRWRRIVPNSCDRDRRDRNDAGVGRARNISPWTV